LRRVELRVSMGGHDVPSDVVKRRFGRSLNNFFNLYAPLADEWTLFDNSSSTQALAVAAKSENRLTVTETKTWLKLQKLSNTV
jgi:predicted ABC-type ATPase